ncbi:cupin domain-containing protein [Xanthovirga aplysinae]|uniref:cupin domain-containing protein n=1 Tax=Xanthovirga aplysinae TaxID=2529853 RepID=UPI0012BD11C4|nr:cupin domain-containing protein [Xanthovirga aplysinae]MTI33230.1 cupin domain-containing protein [Xanthovirga aplysinae]
MKNTILTLFLGIIIYSKGYSQKIHANLNVQQPVGEFDNIKVEPLNGDELSSSFLIWIKKRVKRHKHLEHTEQVFVLAGEGRFWLGEQELQLKTGDFVFIPKNTPHAVEVTSKEPLKVLSIQSPKFDGSDRVWLEEATEK